MKWNSCNLRSDKQETDHERERARVLCTAQKGLRAFFQTKSKQNNSNGKINGNKAKASEVKTKITILNIIIFQVKWNPLIGALFVIDFFFFFLSFAIYLFFIVSIPFENTHKKGKLLKSKLIFTVRKKAANKAKQTRN